MSFNISGVWFGFICYLVLTLTVVIVTKRIILFLYLAIQMELSGIPGVTENAGKYVQKALLPDSSDAEATAVFTR